MSVPSNPVFVALTAILLSMTAAATAHAACVAPLTVDDALLPEDRNAASALFEWAVSEQAGPLEPAPCEDIYSVRHLVLAGDIQVIVSGPAGSVQRRAGQDLSRLPSIYQALVRQVAQTATSSDTEYDPSVLSQSDAGTSVDSDASFEVRWLARFGGATTISADAQVEPDPGFGLGVRMWNRRAGFEISAFNLTFDEGAPTGTWIRFMPMLLLGGQDSQTRGYLGAGLGWGTVSVEGTNFDGTQRADGIQADITLGASFLEQLPVRPFAEAVVGLPLFGVEEVGVDGVPGDRTHWTPSFGFAIGVAFEGF